MSISERRPKRLRTLPVSWFVEPLDEEANRRICNLIRPSDREEYPGVKCGDNKQHDLYGLESHRLSFLVRSRKADRHLGFDIWMQIGDGPKLRFEGNTSRGEELARAC
jgi:hypothetical protein